MNKMSIDEWIKEKLPKKLKIYQLDYLKNQSEIVKLYLQDIG